MVLMRLGFGACLLIAIACASSPDVVTPDTIDATIERTSGASITQIPGQGARLRFNGIDDVIAFRLATPRDWSSMTHVEIDLTNTGNLAMNLVVGVESGASWEHWISANVSVAAGQSARLALPLIDPRPFQGVEAHPTLEDSSLTQLIGYGTTLRSQITFVRFANVDRRVAEFQVRRVRAIQRTIRTTAWVDSFGQQNHIDFPGKAQTADDLRTFETLSGSFPYPADSFGAYTGGPRHASGPRFRLHREGGRWTLVAPSGYPFFSTGVNEVGFVAYTRVEGREHIFQGLPAGPSDPLHEHFNLWNENGRDVVVYNFHHANLHRKFGPAWLRLSTDNNIARMRTWGFNTLGANSNARYEERRELATTPLLLIRGPHAEFAMHDGMMPDVFDSRFRSSVRESLRARLIALNAEPLNVGVFVDNELPWGRWRSHDPNLRWDLPLTVLRLAPGAPAKERFLSLLQRRYRTIARLNIAWRTNYGSWADLRANGSITLGRNPMPIRMERDFSNFITLFATVYFSEIRRVMREANYQGLHLGNRFLAYGYTPEVLAVCQRFCDVVSVNLYYPIPELNNADLKNKNFPVLISEMGFGSFDRGRVGFAPFQTLTEADRVAAYDRYMRAALQWNNLVGVHWYRFEDFPPSGRIGDGENYSIGLVTIGDAAYEDLTAKATELNALMMTRFGSGSRGY